MRNEQGLFEDLSVVQKVDALLINAISLRASDIHLEQTSEGLRVRFRIDGQLFDQGFFPVQLSTAMIARIKIMAHLDITERRIPQDGKFQVAYDENEIDLRVATFPALWGEKVVIRILNKALQSITLESIGLKNDMLVVLKELLSRQHGFFLVTGPTGSGKTTTLYAALAFLNDARKNIITLEDPVEYCVEGITQSQVQPLTGFTFEKGMRALVRQDPDIIMVGEIRDKTTARVAVEAALTGHLVLSTVHTADSIGVLMRLLDMGIEPFLINASLSGVLAQRLVRTLCSACKTKRAITHEEKVLLKSYSVECTELYQPNGCQLCDDQGYKGRTGIFELLVLSPDIRLLIMQNPDYSSLLGQAVHDGIATLAQDGAQKVKDGVISIEEFLRVIV